MEWILTEHNVQYEEQMYGTVGLQYKLIKNLYFQICLH